MATNNENTEIDEAVQKVYGTSSTMRSTLVMVRGGIRWWRYIIEYTMVYDDTGMWFPEQGGKPHKVFIEDNYGIKECVGKKLIWDTDKQGVRLVDSNYVIPHDGEEDYNGQNISI